MAFFEHRLSNAICAGSRGGPVFSTSRVYTGAGHRQANANWPAPKHRYDISFGIKLAAHLDEVLALFYNVRGGFDGFRFRDLRDYRHDDRGAAPVLTPVSGAVWQLGKRYTIGSRSFTRTIHKPVDGTVVIKDAGGATLDAAVDPTTGRATVTGTPATWTGEFDVPVEFVDDSLEDLEMLGSIQNLLLSLPSIKVQELLIRVAA